MALCLLGCQTAPKLDPRPVALDQSQCPALEYPDAAMRQNVQGAVVLGGVVALDGTVSDVRVVQSMVSADTPADDAAAAQALDDAAVRYFGQCRFAPVTGAYAPAQVRLPVRFQLQ